MLPGQRSKHPLLPHDATPEEYKILEHSLSRIYEKFDDPTDKFLIAFVFELGYTRVLAADCLDMPYWVIAKRVDSITKELSIRYKIRTSDKVK